MQRMIQKPILPAPGTRRPTSVATLALAFLALGGASADAQTPIAVDNAGFEELYLGGNLPAQYGGVVPAGAFPTGAPPSDWTAYYENGSPMGGMFLGVLNPGTAAQHAPNPAYFPAGAPEGNNAVLVYMSGDAGGDEFGVEQTLTDTLQAGTTYVLTVEVGNIASGSGLVAPYNSFFDLQGFPGYRVQLLAGGQVIAEDTGNVAPGEGIFETTTVMHTTGASPSQLGQPLGIRLVSQNQPDVPGVDGLEVDFDDVRLSSVTPSAVPLAPVVAAVVLPFALALAGLVLCVRRPR